MKRRTLPHAAAISFVRDDSHAVEISPGTRNGPVGVASRVGLLVAVLLIATSPCLPALTPTSSAIEATPPGAEDKCPVCGMFVARYPDWVAQVTFADGLTRYFDGPKDMFRFLLDIQKYAPGKSRHEVSAIYLTEYYALRSVRAEDTWFVTGSDVYGPMGHELVPFASQEDAQVFLRDHKGTQIHRMESITQDVIDELD